MRCLDGALLLTHVLFVNRYETNLAQTLELVCYHTDFAIMNNVWITITG